MYSKKIAIEGRVLSDLTTNHIIPVAISYQNVLLENVRNLKDIYGDKDFRKMAASQMDLIKCISEDISAAESMVDELDKLVAELPADETSADAYHDQVIPLLEGIRKHVDSLEMMVDDQMWPLPKYRELLFIH
jgi:glutamine synthetase